MKCTRRKYANGKTTWRGIYTDPDTGKAVAVNLDRLGLTTAAARREWAIRQHKVNAARRAELAAGAPPRTTTPPDDARDDYLASCAHRLRPRTVDGYRKSVERFVGWLGDARIRHVEDLTSPDLARFRDSVIARPRRRPAQKGRRGEREETTGRTSPASTNRVLRETKAFLNYLRVRGLTPHLAPHEITEALKTVRAPRVKPEPLSPEECAALLRAAIAHDVATFKATRKEHARYPSRENVGRTRKHDSIAPFVLTVLLTGCRVGEALALAWESVDLDAPDDYGNPAGEIRLRATGTKTHAERRIDLAVAPSLRTLLAALRVRSGGRPFVFGGVGPLTRDRVEAARRRLVGRYEAPAFTWQRLRQTCASYLTNAGGIFRAASIYRSAEQLGHSPDVANRHYLGRIRGIPESARTLEAALKIEKLAASVVALARGADPASLDLDTDRGAA